MADFTGVMTPTPAYTPTAGTRRVTPWLPITRAGISAPDPTKLGGTTGSGGTPQVTKTVGQLWPRG